MWRNGLRIHLTLLVVLGSIPSVKLAPVEHFLNSRYVLWYDGDGGNSNNSVEFWSELCLLESWSWNGSWCHHSDGQINKTKKENGWIATMEDVDMI